MFSLEAQAKINLTLDVLGKRPDGYHEVEMIRKFSGLGIMIFADNYDC